MYGRRAWVIPAKSCTGAGRANSPAQPSARRIREQYIPRFRETGRLDRLAIEFVTRQGATFEVFVTTTAEHDESGEFLHSLCVFAEVSDQALLERRYQDHYQSTPAMLHTIDPDGHITEVSNHWLRKLGYDRDEVLGRSILDFMTDESRRPLKGRMRQIISEGERENVPRQMVTKSGEVIDVLMSSRTERDAHQAIIRTFVASKDVTDRNRAEASLKLAYAGNRAGSRKNSSASGTICAKKSACR